MGKYKNPLICDKNNLFKVSRHLRNMYVHGELSARPNGVNAKKFSFFLQALTHFFISEIKANFSKKS